MHYCRPLLENSKVGRQHLIAKRKGNPVEKLPDLGHLKIAWHHSDG
jgi:hypothetical protein